MSHFTVMVVGDDVEYQLAPFHEFECTGYDDEFVVNVDKLPEAKLEFEKSEQKTLAEFIEYYYGAKIIEGDAEPDLAGEHKYGWARVKDGEVIEFVDRTNPNKQWDWWVIGGRWSGMLVLKGGGTADQARKSDIDFAAMQGKAGSAAAKEWDEMAEARQGNDVWTPFELVRNQCASIEEAREKYWAQPAVVAMKKAGGFSWGGFDQYLMPREDFINKDRDGALSTFAFLKDRQWSEKGSMGWFGMSIDKMTQDEWNAWMSAQIEALPDDAMITIVDAHV